MKRGAVERLAEGLAKCRALTHLDVHGIRVQPEEEGVQVAIGVPALALRDSSVLAWLDVPVYQNSSGAEALERLVAICGEARQGVIRNAPPKHRRMARIEAAF